MLLSKKSWLTNTKSRPSPLISWLLLMLIANVFHGHCNKLTRAKVIPQQFIDCVWHPGQFHPTLARKHAWPLIKSDMWVLAMHFMSLKKMSCRGRIWQEWRNDSTCRCMLQTKPAVSKTHVGSCLLFFSAAWRGRFFDAKQLIQKLKFAWKELTMIYKRNRRNSLEDEKEEAPRVQTLIPAQHLKYCPQRAHPKANYSSLYSMFSWCIYSKLDKTRGRTSRYLDKNGRTVK